MISLVKEKYVYLMKYEKESSYSPPDFYCARDIADFLDSYEEAALKNYGDSYNFFKATINKPNSWKTIIEFDDFINELYQKHDNLHMIKYLDTLNENKYKNESKYFDKIWNNLKVKIKKYKPCHKLDNINYIYVCDYCELITDRKKYNCKCTDVQKILLLD
jgi:hypothetical protein